jgi:hypothetical protein
MKKTAVKYTKEDKKEALRALSSMISKIRKAQLHFSKGTPQHTLAKNRLKALRLASTLIARSLRD